MKAPIFNIQKFSLNDGPGLRTVIFFKGCPLRCKWCSNPESQASKTQILWNKDKCIGCGACTKNCSQKAITFLQGNICIRNDVCNECGICVKNCSGYALTSQGELKTVEDVLRICRQDLPFYEESGGGITLSGGEALMYPDFTVALLEAAHSEGLHTTMETSGFATQEVFERVTSSLDLLLFDLKHWEERKHMRGTGVSNRLILKNLNNAILSGKEVLPRIPVIPDYNDSLTDAEGFCRRLQEASIKRVQLLPFHQFGEKKYTMLGRDYAYSDMSMLHEEDLKAYRKVFLQNEIEAFF